MTPDTSSDRDRWNAKFLAGEAQSAQPDPFLIETCANLTPGRALDLAGGAGRHALWLAQRGWTVTLADLSDEGLAIASQRAAAASIAVTTRREAAEETVAWAAGSQPFDLIVVVWCLLRGQFALLPSALAPGGLLLYKTYTSEHIRYSEGHSLGTALHPGELSSAFPLLTTVLYRESNGVAELLARSG
jgi:SAM-dependent methyltransferase